MEISDLSNEMTRNDFIERNLSRRRDVPDDVQILELLAQTRFATAGQLTRIFYDNAVKNECDRLKKLLRKKLVGKITNIVISRGRHKGQRTWVYFLTDAGKDELRKYLPVSAAFAKTGFPDKTNHLRINHQLLATEMFLYYHQRHTIYECRNEDCLKSEIQHEKTLFSRILKYKNRDGNSQFAGK